MNYLITMEKLTVNPMARVRKRTSEPRSVIWTHDQVLSFLDTAFTKFDWRNIGLIVLMCYEWGQRPVDIRNLTWDQLDLDEAIVKITYPRESDSTLFIEAAERGLGLPTVCSTSPQATGQRLQAANSFSDDYPAWRS